MVIDLVNYTFLFNDLGALDNDFIFGIYFLKFMIVSSKILYRGFILS